jgi:serine/threonine-protein kinase HipA
MSTCLICSELCEKNDEYHDSCLKELFGNNRPPVLDYKLGDLTKLAKKVVRQKVTVPGVQAKLSLEIDRQVNESNKLTIVGLWGRYILKPPSNRWKELPENEHCTMLLAKSSGIETVPSGLVRLKSGELSYVTRRIDRGENGEKYAMEDMCQLTERLTEDKYKGSHEQIAKIIKKYSENPIYDLTRYYEMVLFCYITGNSDMHLKNFSLINDPELGWKLSAGYDLLSTRLVISEKYDPEELALTLGGKKRKFTKNSFPKFGFHIGLGAKQVENILSRMKLKSLEYHEQIEKSFLSNELKEKYKDLIHERRKAMGW